MSKDQEILDFIEAFGKMVSDSGLPPSIGKVMGLLIISEPSRLSAEEIKSIIGISSGAISAATNFLIKFGYVRRTTEPGRRRHYYEFEAASWQRAVDLRLAQMKEGIILAEEGLKIRHEDPRLIGMRSLYEQLHEAISKIKIET